jgi:hypothetical protein
MTRKPRVHEIAARLGRIGVLVLAVGACTAGDGESDGNSVSPIAVSPQCQARCQKHASANCNVDVKAECDAAVAANCSSQAWKDCEVQVSVACQASSRKEVAAQCVAGVPVVVGATSDATETKDSVRDHPYMCPAHPREDSPPPACATPQCPDCPTCPACIAPSCVLDVYVQAYAACHDAQSGSCQANSYAACEVEASKECMSEKGAQCTASAEADCTAVCGSD